jgi:hypothetical protein
MTTFIDKHEVCKLLKVGDRTLGRYREKYWFLGIHFAQPVQRILYNKELIEDWMVNRHDYPAHLRAIESYQATLPSNQKRRRAS